MGGGGGEGGGLVISGVREWRSRKGTVYGSMEWFSLLTDGKGDVVGRWKAR